MSDKESNSKSPNDKDLDELLNSALNDFDADSQASSRDKGADAAEDKANAEIWNQVSQQAKLFEEKMSNVFGGTEGAASGDQMSSTFQKMAEAAALAVKELDENAVIPSETQLAESLTEALKSMKEGSGLLHEPVPADGLSGMFSAMNLDEDSGENPFLPMMQGMMQSLLSAEVLLPSLKEMLDKYPAWFDENKDTISAEDKERYTKQQELFKVICGELEKETPNDSTEVKNERFKIVLKNMQKLNEFGQPPAGLIGDAAAGGIPEFDPSQFNDPSQCSVM